MPKSGIITIPLHIGDFLGGTMHMDTLEKGAYLMLLLAHYQIGVDGLPNDQKKLSRIAGVTLKVWDRICPTLREKFTITDHFWEHKKVIEIIRKVEHISSQNSAKALKRHNSDIATAEPLICQPKPKPKPIEKEDTIVSSKKNLNGCRIDYFLTNHPDGGIDSQNCPDDLGNWAIQEFKWDVPKTVGVWAGFCDYWLAKTGAGATKRDWPATWRNWCRKAAEHDARSDYILTQQAKRSYAK